MIIVKLFHPHSCEVFHDCKIELKDDHRIWFTGKGEDDCEVSISTNLPYSVLTKSR